MDIQIMNKVDNLKKDMTISVEAYVIEVNKK